METRHEYGMRDWRERERGRELEENMCVCVYLLGRKIIQRYTVKKNYEFRKFYKWNCRIFVLRGWLLG